MEEYFSKFTQKGLPGGPNELKAFTEGFIVSSQGQWAYPGMNTLIPNAGGRITMQGVEQPVLGIDDLGNEMLMQPGEEYQFPGDSVYEIPMKKGGLVKMPKLTKKNKKSYAKKFSRSLEATNRLFTENELFEKPKSKKKKVFDPKSEYRDGGAYYDDSRDAWVSADGTVGPNGPAYYEDGGFIEAELSDEEIEEYKKGGWVVEELDTYDGGGSVTFSSYEQQLKQLENSIKAGYKNGKWYPHNSVEGGTKTIGYGHKLSSKENYSSGLTTAQVLALQKKDLANHTNIAKSMVDKKYGAGTFNKLPESRKVLLVDYAYNGVLHEFPNFMDATVKGDKNKMLKEYMRYTNGKPLTQRNAWTKSVIEGTIKETKPVTTPKALPAKPAAKQAAVKKPVPKKPVTKPTFTSNETYSYDNRPGAVYKVADSGDWYINLGNQTQNNFVPMNDPTGKRMEILRKYAHINEAPLSDILHRINNSGNYDIREDLGYVPGQ